MQEALNVLKWAAVIVVIVLTVFLFGIRVGTGVLVGFLLGLKLDNTWNGVVKALTFWKGKDKKS